jgi:hypothetical protein
MLYQEMNNAPTTTTSSSSPAYYIASIGKTNSMKIDVKQLRLNASLKESPSFLSSIMCMFHERNWNIYSAFELKHKSQNTYNELKRNIYLPVEFYDEIKYHGTHECLRSCIWFPEEDIVAALNPNQVRYIFIILPSLMINNQANNESSTSILICVDISKFLINLLLPSSSVWLVSMEQIQEVKLNTLKCVGHLFPPGVLLLPPVNNWACTQNQGAHFELLQMNSHHHDECIYLLIMIYFLEENLPLYFSPTDCNAFRINLTFWMLRNDGKFPYHSYFC